MFCATLIPRLRASLRVHDQPETPSTIAEIRTLAHYVKPQVLCIDELGYLPIDKFGADCLFQIISHRYERGATPMVRT